MSAPALSTEDGDAFRPDRPGRLEKLGQASATGSSAVLVDVAREWLEQSIVNAERLFENEGGPEPTAGRSVASCLGVTPGWLERLRPAATGQLVPLRTIRSVEHLVVIKLKAAKWGAASHHGQGTSADEERVAELLSIKRAVGAQVAAFTSVRMDSRPASRVVGTIEPEPSRVVDRTPEVGDHQLLRHLRRAMDGVQADIGKKSSTEYRNAMIRSRLDIVPAEHRHLAAALQANRLDSASRPVARQAVDRGAAFQEQQRVQRTRSASPIKSSPGRRSHGQLPPRCVAAQLRNLFALAARDARRCHRVLACWRLSPDRRLPRLARWAGRGSHGRQRALRARSAPA